MGSKWPNPGDLPVDRARQVASEYRRALCLLDSETCRTIDRAAISVGEGWVNPALAPESLDDYVTFERGAEIVGRSSRWVYKWTSENPESVREGRPKRVLLRDLVDAVGYERSWRARRADSPNG